VLPDDMSSRSLPAAAASTVAFGIGSPTAVMLRESVTMTPPKCSVLRRRSTTTGDGFR
jgi:hypothetical protein